VWEEVSPPHQRKGLGRGFKEGAVSPPQNFFLDFFVKLKYFVAFWHYFE